MKNYKDYILPVYIEEQNAHAKSDNIFDSELVIESVHKGNGFFVGDMFVTAAHVVEPHSYIMLNGKRVWLKKENAVFWREIPVKEYGMEFYKNDNSGDVAVFKMENVNSPLVLAEVLPPEGEELDSFYHLKDGGHESQAVVGHGEYFFAGNFFGCIHNPIHPTTGGSSGSPVLKDNVVYGILHGGNKEHPEYCTFTSAAFVNKHLKKTIKLLEVMSNLKHEFLSLLRSTKREQVETVIGKLEELGFFEAPASTNFHLNVAGGLVQHSLNVCHVGLRLREQMIQMDPELADALSVESVIIATLLHDVCKAEIYKKVIKKRKNKTGAWEDYEGYDVDYNNFPLGHGEKSVIRLLQWGFPLTDEEIMAIRWHMHAWELPFQSYEAKGNYNVAKEHCPLVSLVQAADNLASSMLEKKSEE